MKRLIATIAIAALTVAPVAARDYNMQDPNVRPVAAPAAPVQTDRYQTTVKKPGKPAPEFWYILGAGVLALVFFAAIDKGPNHGTPPVGQAGVNKP